MEYIIGADGGGTKTILSAADTSGSVLTEASTGGINYNFIGVERAADNFNAGVKKLGIKPQDIAAIAIGDPSIDDINILETTSAFITELRSKIPLRNDCKLFIKSDAFMTLYGITSGQTGVLMISGTGAMGIALDSDGNVHVAGGWGRLTEDEGSGYYIAINGLKAALRYHDGIGQHTLLYGAMLNFFNEPNPRKLIYSFYEQTQTSPEIAPFSSVVSRCAQSGDTEAINILDNAARLLASYTISLIKRINAEKCKIGIYGSVLTNDLYVRERFSDIVNAEYPGAEIVIPKTKPQHAAILYALNNIKQQ